MAQSLPPGPIRAVARKAPNTLNVDEQPIILVPGIMGSRLHVAGAPGNPMWDPDNTFAMLKLADKRTMYRAAFMHVRNRADVYAAPYTAANCNDAQRRRGWGGVAWGFYGAGLQSLERFSRPMGGVVYAFGYDWRMSNWLTGDLLKRRIAQIRAAHGGKKVLVVTHSMGGLVTRAACRQGAEGDVLGVVHTMQPADGTPITYRQAKLGGAALDWASGSVVLGRIVGRDAVQYSAVAAGMRGAFELFPNDSHSRATGNEERQAPGVRSRYSGWLSFDRNLPVKLPASYSIYDLYLEDTGVLGLIDFGFYRRTKEIHIAEAYLLDDVVDGPAIAQGITEGVNGAREFHRTRLRGYVHPNTSVIAGNDLECDVAVHIDRATHWFGRPDTPAPAMIRAPLGDGTVSVSSATALPLRGCDDAGLKASDRQVFISGVAHADAFGTSPLFNNMVWNLCQQVMRCAPKR